MTRTTFLFAATLVLSVWAVACNGGGADSPDYLTPELRSAVEQLKLDVAAGPTDETTVAERARVLSDWVDAYALGGGEVGLEGPRVRLQATNPPTGQAALAQGAIIDRLVRQFALHDEPGALGELTAESLGPFEARSHQTIRQSWAVGTHPVVAGGGFWVARHFSVDSGPFQTEDPAGEGYVTIATTDADARFETDVYLALPVPHNFSLDFMQPLRYGGRHGDSESGFTYSTRQPRPPARRAGRGGFAGRRQPRAGR